MTVASPSALKSPSPTSSAPFLPPAVPLARPNAPPHPSSVLDCIEVSLNMISFGSHSVMSLEMAVTRPEEEVAHITSLERQLVGRYLKPPTLRI